MRVFIAALLIGFWGMASAFVHIRQEALIPMSDGKFLAADVYLPAAEGAWPVILYQTPYNKNWYIAKFLTDTDDDPLLKNPNYAFVMMDWRGYFGSSGAAVSNPDYGQDGYDAIEWIAAQPWSTGAVGTCGPSALGYVQFLTAQKQPPHLRCCVPMVAHIGSDYEQFFGGGELYRNYYTFMQTKFDLDPAFLSHPIKDSFWVWISAAAQVAASQVNVPMLHISGWYDHDVTLSLQTMDAIGAVGGSGARGRQKMLIGPWCHSHLGERVQGQLEYPSAEWVPGAAAVEFFDFYLRGIQNGYESRPLYRLFQINEDVWETSGVWPPSGGKTLRYYLTPDRALSRAAPASPDAALEYTSDPNNPVPTLCGAILTQDGAVQGPGDLSPIESRADLLTFSTPPLDSPMRIRGQAAARLWITCDAVDTDLAVRMTQVTPAGQSFLLVDSIQRASIPPPFTARRWLQPGAPTAIEVTLPPVAVTIPQGHRLRINVAGSNWDRFDKNPQDGSMYSDSEGVVLTPARVRILLNSQYPSTFEVPLIGGAGSWVLY